MCSYHYQHDAEIEFFQKYVGFDAEQVKWLKNEALKIAQARMLLYFRISFRFPAMKQAATPIFTRVTPQKQFLQ